MKTTALRLLASSLFFLALTFPPEAHAAMGEIKTPKLIVKDQPETEAALEKVLQRPDAKYLKGHWLNRWSSLQYGGDTTALNMMVADLAQCPGLSVSLTFQKLNNEASWIVGQNANAAHIQVTVNLSSPHIAVERISLPAWTGAKTAK
jgi:hypothetical protein